MDVKRLKAYGIQTVMGMHGINWGGPVDAHTHAWIEPVPGSTPGSPVLDNYPLIVKELKDFYRTGGRGLIDCQPLDCGRNAQKLRQLSKDSGVEIVCCTGFHRQKYYPADSEIWNRKADDWEQLFTGELLESVIETREDSQPIRAGFIKIAAEAELKDTPQQALDAAIHAAVTTNSGVEIHTEKGASAESIVDLFIRRGVQPDQIVLCHMDKRSDAGLHQELAKSGALLEYDTFFRHQYEPEKNLWPLLFQMIEAGYSGSIALAMDMADSAMWASMGIGPGMTGLIRIIQARLEQATVPGEIICSLLGGNILSRIARYSLD